MKSILDPDFKYVSSLNTDIRARFERIRKEMKDGKESEAGQTSACTPETPSPPSGGGVVTSLVGRARKGPTREAE